MNLQYIFKLTTEMVPSDSKFIRSRYFRKKGDIRRNKRVDAVLNKMLHNANAIISHKDTFYLCRNGQSIPEPSCTVGGGRYSIITIPKSKLFANGYAYYSSIFHEISHAVRALYETEEEMRRKFFDMKDFIIEELIAESTAILLCNYFNIGNKNSIKSNLIYMKIWLNHYESQIGRKFYQYEFEENVVPEVQTRFEIILKGIDYA